MKTILSGLAIALLIAGGAVASDHPITTAGASQATPPSSVAPAAVAALPAAPVQITEPDAGPAAAESRPGCAAAEAAERQPHGEVWGGVGTHGYRDAGGAVTLPTGKCSSVSIAVDRMEGGFIGWRR